jgi:hypothetical protein
MQIENKLCNSDFAKILDGFRTGSIDSMELLPMIKFDCAVVSPLVLSGSDKECTISARIMFDDPLGNTACFNAGIKELGITKSARQIDLVLKKSLESVDELGNAIAYGLLLVEKVVNYACMIRSETAFDSFVLDSKSIEEQIEKSKKEKDRELRHEKLEPFVIVHADSGFDLNAQSRNLIPMYEGYDRWDLFGGKKAYRLLPRSFAAKLLKCDENSLVPEEQFSKAERNVLEDYVKKRYLRSTKVAGKVCYFGLGEKTRTYLIKALRANA